MTVEARVNATSAFVRLIGFHQSKLAREFEVHTASATSSAVSRAALAAGATGRRFVRMTASPTRATLPDSLLHEQQEAIRLAKEYREKHGDPVDNLVRILGEIVQDEEVWRTILDEPYG